MAIGIVGNFREHQYLERDGLVGLGDLMPISLPAQMYDVSMNGIRFALRQSAAKVAHAFAGTSSFEHDIGKFLMRLCAHLHQIRRSSPAGMAARAMSCKEP